jgi:hypothetical protein
MASLSLRYLSIEKMANTKMWQQQWHKCHFNIQSWCNFSSLSNGFSINKDLSFYEVLLSLFLPFLSRWSNHHRWYRSGRVTGVCVLFSLSLSSLYICFPSSPFSPVFFLFTFIHNNYNKNKRTTTSRKCTHYYMHFLYKRVLSSSTATWRPAHILLNPISIIIYLIQINWLKRKR